jgi:hypothetical protein
MSDITLFNFAFDNDRRLTKVIYKGREASIAQEFRRLLHYGNKGTKLVNSITDKWGERFQEGTDF